MCELLPPFGLRISFPVYAGPDEADDPENQGPAEKKIEKEYPPVLFAPLIQAINQGIIYAAQTSASATTFRASIQSILITRLSEIYNHIILLKFQNQMDTLSQRENVYPLTPETSVTSGRGRASS